MAECHMWWTAGLVDGLAMSEATVGEVEVEEVQIEVEEGQEERYRDRRSLEAELQAIARSKLPEPETSPGFWSKRRRKG
jgi:hypothetical protein